MEYDHEFKQISSNERVTLYRVRVFNSQKSKSFLISRNTFAGKWYMAELAPGKASYREWELGTMLLTDMLDVAYVLMKYP